MSPATTRVRESGFLFVSGLSAPGFVSVKLHRNLLKMRRLDFDVRYCPWEDVPLETEGGRFTDRNRARGRGGVHERRENLVALGRFDIRLRRMLRLFAAWDDRGPPRPPSK